MSAAPLNRRGALRTLGAAALVAAGGVSAAETGLAAVKARGTLTVAVYRDMPPFHDHGQGIDVDLAGALAESLGVKLSLMPFPAGEDMNDDLRNMEGPTASNSRSGWAVGLAVKNDAADLAQALQAAVDGLIAQGRMQQIFSKGKLGWRLG